MVPAGGVGEQAQGRLLEQVRCALGHSDWPRCLTPGHRLVRAGGEQLEGSALHTGDRPRGPRMVGLRDMRAYTAAVAVSKTRLVLARTFSPQTPERPEHRK